MNSPIKWHGGKYYLAKKIVELMPRHLHYVEPYFGSGAVLFARDPNDQRLEWGTKSHERGVSEVVNDINSDLTNFWRVLANPHAFRAFSRFLQAVPFSEREWNRSNGLAKNGLVAPEETQEVQAAIHFFLHCRQSLAGRMKSFAPLSKNRTRRGMNEQASAWLSAIEGLPEAHARLRGVVSYCRDALEVIRKEDGRKTLFYCDPPYLHVDEDGEPVRASPDVYQHEMTIEQHIDLLETLDDISGHFLLSGYPNKIYDRYALREGWRRVDFNLPNNAAGGDSKRRMTECVWMNYKPEEPRK